MGTELSGHMVDGKKRKAVRADFASDRVILRGSMSGEVEYAQVEPAVEGGLLVLTVHGMRLEFDAGDRAERLAAKIREPPGRAKKLGVRPGQVVHLLGLDGAVAGELQGAGATVRQGEPTGACDGLLVLARTLADLADALRLGGHAAWVWVVYPKGRPELKEADVREAFRGQGWKDVKTMRWDQELTALRFVR